jgi:hypothetical protein
LPTFPIANAVTARDGNLSSITASESPDSVEIPLIETLELIQGPDGSPTEDFMMPDRKELRPLLKGLLTGTAPGQFAGCRCLLVARIGSIFASDRVAATNAS